MRSKSVLMVLVYLIATAAAQLPEPAKPQKPKKPRAQVYALEGLGALGGMTGCALGGSACYLAGGAVATIALFMTVLSGSGSNELMEGWYRFGWVVGGLSAAAVPAVAGYGAAKAGKRLGEDGSMGWAISGAYAGAVVGTGFVALVQVLRRAENGSVYRATAIPLCVLGGLCIPSGAVLGYNLSIPHEAPDSSRSGIGSRLELPAVALTAVELPDHSVEYGVRVQLAGLRF